MFVRASKQPNAWVVQNAWGHELRLPLDDQLDGREFRIGVMGTQRRTEFKRKTGESLSGWTGQMLADLGRDVFLLDVRRDGVGGRGFWSPLEFATQIPDALPTDLKYCFLHLPCLAPSSGLKDDPTLSWRDFRDGYLKELSTDSVAVARAFVESATVADGLAAFVCSCADQPDFDQLSKVEKEKHYCHRFALAKQVANAIRADYGPVPVKLVHLDLCDYWTQRTTAPVVKYTPRETAL